jgi:hypothetical protein
MLLVDGVYASSSVLGRRGPVSTAVQFADDLVRAAVGAAAAT